MTDKITIKLVAGEQRIRAQKLIGRPAPSHTPIWQRLVRADKREQVL